MFEVKKLNEERGIVAAEINEMTNTIQREKRSFSDDEMKRFDDLDKKYTDLDKQIETANRVNKFVDKKDNGDVVVRNHRTDYRPVTVTPRDHEMAFKCWALKETGNKSRIKRAHAEAFSKVGLIDGEAEYIVPLSFDGNITRAESSDTTNEGIALVNGSLFIGLENNLKAFGGLRKVARVRRMDSGEPLHYAYSDDTSNSSVVQNSSGTPNQNKTVSNTSKTYAPVAVGVWDHVTAVYPVSIQLLEDTTYSVTEDVSAAIGGRLGRGTALMYQQGAGSTEGTGLCVSGSTATTTASTSVPTYAELLSFYNSLDPAYQDDPSFAWIMHQTNWAKLQGLLDANNRPIFWNYGMSASSPDNRQIFGKPVIIDNSMPSNGANRVFAAAGAMDRFFIRDVKDARIFTQRETLLSTLSIGFIGLLRTDGVLLNTNAIKLMKTHS